MKISTKGRYALRLMLDLALHNTGEFITLKSIAARQEISDKYLEQIINLLGRGGFVKSSRGAQGGYKLVKSPAEYTIGSILRQIEGSLAPVACVDEEYRDCTRYESCATLFIYEKINEAINDVVDHITLDDLVKRQEEIERKVEV